MRFDCIGAERTPECRRPANKRRLVAGATATFTAVHNSYGSSRAYGRAEGEANGADNQDAAKVERG